jgi:hypothetical protein
MSFTTLISTRLTRVNIGIKILWKAARPGRAFHFDSNDKMIMKIKSWPDSGNLQLNVGSGPQRVRGKSWHLANRKLFNGWHIHCTLDELKLWVKSVINICSCINLYRIFISVILGFLDWCLEGTEAWLICHTALSYWQLRAASWMTAIISERCDEFILHVTQVCLYACQLEWGDYLKHWLGCCYMWQVWK